MKPILITGGLGFIGSHAAIEFDARHYPVIVVDNLSRPQLNLKKPQEMPFNWTFFDQYHSQIKKVKLDVRDFAGLLKLMKEIQPEIILHAAGQTSAVGSVVEPKNDFENNAIGLFNTLEAARIAGTVKDFVYLSTNKVYGNIINNFQLIENETRYSPKDPQYLGFDESNSIDQSEHTPYGVSKLTGDLYVQEYGHLYGINTAVFRMSCIYGARQFGFIEQGWISHLLITALNRKPITIFGTGKQVRDVLYIDDLTNLFMKYVTWAKRKGSNVFNIGGGKEYSISLLDAIKIIEDLLGEKVELKFEQERPGDQRYYVSNIAKAMKLLKWKPLITPQEGIKRSFEWHKSNRDLFI